MSGCWEADFENYWKDGWKYILKKRASGLIICLFLIHDFAGHIVSTPKTMKINLVAFLLLFLNACTSGDRATQSPQQQDRFGLMVYTTIEDGQQAAHRSGKPLLLLFDCPNMCANRKLRQRITDFLLKEKTILDGYELVYLQVDDRTSYSCTTDHPDKSDPADKETIGAHNTYLMIELFGSTGTPYLGIADADLNIIRKQESDYFKSDEELRHFLHPVHSN